VIAFAVALRLDREQRPREATDDNGAVTLDGDARVALMLYAIAGGIALGYEVVWTQTVVQFLSTRVFAFSIVLATYLTGLAIGSALYARRADRIGNPWAVFGILIASAGLVGLLEVMLLRRWLIYGQTGLEALVVAVTGSDLAGMTARFAAAAACIVLLPTILLG